MLVRLDRDIDSLFQTILSDPWMTGPAQVPNLNIAAQDDETVVLAELPGVKKEDLKLTVHDGLLTIAGTRKENGLPENSRWIRHETTSGAFSRSIELPHSVNAEGVSAELTNGILKVVLPKAEDARPREIAVK